MTVSPSAYAQPFVRGCGSVEIVPGVAPAAASGFSFTNPGSFVSYLLALVFQLATDANAANRSVRLEYDDGNGLVFAGEGSSTVITASKTALFRHQTGRAAADADSNLFVYAPTPDVYLLPGQKLLVNVTNMQAGDQLSGIAMTFERFRTGDG